MALTEFKVTKGEIVFPTPINIQKIHKLQDSNPAWGNDQTIWETTSINATEVGTGKGSRKIICNLLLMYGYYITYRKEDLADCRKICHTCTNYPHKTDIRYTCMCSKPNITARIKAHEGWLKQDIGRTQN